jgi:hypothetical protein
VNDRDALAAISALLSFQRLLFGVLGLAKPEQRSNYCSERHSSEDANLLMASVRSGRYAARKSEAGVAASSR